MFSASIRTLWKRLVFRGVDFGDKHGAFENAYLVSDPYNLEIHKNNIVLCRRIVLLKKLSATSIIYLR